MWTFTWKTQLGRRTTRTYERKRKSLSKLRKCHIHMLVLWHSCVRHIKTVPKPKRSLQSASISMHMWISKHCSTRLAWVFGWNCDMRWLGRQFTHQCSDSSSGFGDLAFPGEVGRHLFWVFQPFVELCSIRRITIHVQNAFVSTLHQVFMWGVLELSWMFF